MGAPKKSLQCSLKHIEYFFLFALQMCVCVLLHIYINIFIFYAFKYLLQEKLHNNPFEIGRLSLNIRVNIRNKCVHGSRPALLEINISQWAISCRYIGSAIMTKALSRRELATRRAAEWRANQLRGNSGSQQSRVFSSVHPTIHPSRLRLSVATLVCQLA